MQYNPSTGATPKPHVVTTIISIITLIISALSLLSSIALLILTNTTVSGGDNIGIEMVGYISGIGLFMICAFILALVGGIAGFIMTIVTLVVKNFKTVWMPIVSMVACIAAVIITVGAL